MIASESGFDSRWAVMNLKKGDTLMSIALESWAEKPDIVEQFYTAVTVILRLGYARYDNEKDGFLLAETARLLRHYARVAAGGEREYWQAINKAELYEAALIG